MAMQDWYKDGTITVTGGSRAFTGAGTSWATQLAKGDLIFVDGLNAVVEEITGNGSGNFVQEWAGPSAAGADYIAVIMPDDSSMAAGVRTILDALTNGVLTSIAYLEPANGDLMTWSDLDQKWQAGKLGTSNFATDVVDVDPLLAANSDTRITSQKAVKSYIDNAITGIFWKNAVQAATTTTLPACTYANGASGVGATLTGNANGALVAQDGVTLTVNQRLLVKNQASGLQNGIYKLTQVGTGSLPYILTRATDTDTGAEMWGAAVFVEAGGTVNGVTQWTNSNTSAPTMGTTAITFGQIAGAGTYSAGSGLTLTGNQFSIGAGQVTNSMLAGSIAASKLVGTDIATVGTVTAGVWNGTIIASGYGGTGNGFTKFTGPATSEKTFTLPNASAVLLYEGGAIGGTTPAAGAFTTLSATGTLTGAAANFSGAVSGLSFSPTGGTFAQGKVYYDAGNGLTLGAKTGSASDFSLIDAANTTIIMSVPTGTTSVKFGGNVLVGTTTTPATAKSGLFAGNLYAGGYFNPAIVSHRAGITHNSTVINGLVLHDTDTGSGTSNSLVLVRNSNALGSIGTTNAHTYLYSFSNALLLGAGNALQVVISSSLAAMYAENDNTLSNGTGSKRWTTIYATTGSINTSDQREKNWRGSMSEGELGAASDILGMIGFYQRWDSLLDKGDDARVHVGLKAQAVRDALGAHGLPATSYAFLCYDKWDADAEKGIKAGDRWGLRENELTWFLMAAQQHQIEKLSHDIALLKAA